MVTRFDRRQPAHGPKHGAIAAESADEIGDRFGEKNAGDAQPADLRQNDRQRHDDDDLAKEREKRRLLALAESDEGALADGLKRHEEKSEEKYVEHRHAFGEQFGSELKTCMIGRGSMKMTASRKACRSR